MLWFHNCSVCAVIIVGVMGSKNEGGTAAAGLRRFEKFYLSYRQLGGQYEEATKDGVARAIAGEEQEVVEEALGVAEASTMTWPYSDEVVAARWLFRAYQNETIIAFQRRFAGQHEPTLSLRRVLCGWAASPLVTHSDGFRWAMGRLLLDDGILLEEECGEGSSLRLRDYIYTVAGDRIEGVRDVFARERHMVDQMRSQYSERDEIIGRFLIWWKENGPYVDWFPDRQMFMVDRFAKAEGIPIERWRGMDEDARRGAEDEAKKRGPYGLEAEVPVPTKLSYGEAVALVASLPEPFDEGAMAETHAACRGKEWLLLGMSISRVCFRKPCLDAVEDLAASRLMRAYPELAAECLQVEVQEERGSVNGLRAGLNWAMDSEVKEARCVEVLINEGIIQSEVCDFECYGVSLFRGEADRLCDWALLLAAKKVEDVKREFGDWEMIAMIESVKERDALLKKFSAWWGENGQKLNWVEERRVFVVEESKGASTQP